MDLDDDEAFLYGDGDEQQPSTTGKQPLSLSAWMNSSSTHSSSSLTQTLWTISELSFELISYIGASW